MKIGEGMHRLATNLSSFPLDGFARIFGRGGALVERHSQMPSREDFTTGPAVRPRLHPTLDGRA
jgi:hypothetical protein